MKKYCFIFLLFIPCWVLSQTYYGRVVDAVNKTGLPFATLRVSKGKQATVTDLNGYFSINISQQSVSLEASYLGYESQILKVNSEKDSLLFLLNENSHLLKEFVVKPPYEKIKRIVNNAILNRPKNNPENNNWYQCKVYYKIIFDIHISDTSIQKMEKDTSADARSILWFVKSQDAFITESYSKRTWKKPQQLQEEIIASKMSGFKRSIFNGLVTDVLPFHSYSDYLRLNNTDYPNPIAKGWHQRYVFNIVDEIYSQEDTIWVLSFQPKNNSFPDLRGRVYIHSNGYAISNLIASSVNKDLKRTVKLEQQYEKVANKWFPKELNYVLLYDRTDISKAVKSKDSTKSKPADTTVYTIVVKGNSKIDSVCFNEEKDFKFDKTHSIIIATDADEMSAEKWQQIRSIPLIEKEKRTYVFNDSLFHAKKIDRFIPYLEKLTEAKVPFKYFDMNLDRVFSYNYYEHTRLGLGLETNEKLHKHFFLGAWAGYGIEDKAWKYGGVADVYLDKYKDFSIEIAYEKNLKTPGSNSLFKELDKTYLNQWLMKKTDATSGFSIGVKKRAGYWDLSLSGTTQTVQPQYAYSYFDIILKEYNFQELAFKFRYAFAERRAPLFNHYYNTGTKYPILYGKIIAGNLDVYNRDIGYAQATLAISWQKHLNRIGNERFLLMTAKSWSCEPLPLSKIFAANGYAVDDKNAYYAFGGLLTMLPYGYYSDAYFSFYWKHDFDRCIYNVQYSAPFLSIAHNFYYGEMSKSYVHGLFENKIPDPAYQESGLILNSLFRIKYVNLYYLTFNLGYFIHWQQEHYLQKDGKLVLGMGVSF